jgi:hypothetical protein
MVNEQCWPDLQPLSPPAHSFQALKSKDGGESQELREWQQEADEVAELLQYQALSVIGLPLKLVSAAGESCSTPVPPVM